MKKGPLHGDKIRGILCFAIKFGFRPLECIGIVLLNTINNTSFLYLHMVRDCVITLYVGLKVAIQVN